MPININEFDVTGTQLPGFVASGTQYDVYKHEQDFMINYEVITYGTTDPNAWPPDVTCTEVSALKCTWGNAWTNISRFPYSSSGTPYSYTQQSFSASSFTTSGDGLGLEGVIYSDNPGSHLRAWTTADNGTTLGYDTEHWFNPPYLVIVEIGDIRIIDGTDGGTSAKNFIRTLVNSIQPGGLQKGVRSWTRGLPAWRDDLVL